MTFNILIVVLLPLTLLLGGAWYTTRKKMYAQILLFLWLFVLGIFGWFFVERFLKTKKNLSREDIYGDYIVDRTKYGGNQADWQYNHFRFSILEDNKFVFYETEKDSVVNTYSGWVSFLEGYKQPRIVIQVDTPSHYAIDPHPTLFRKPFTFYYVFHSPKIGNVFFTKGKWKPL